MKEDLITQEKGSAVEIHNNEIRQKVQAFIKEYLNKEPKQSEIKVNQLANNSRYLPISFVEMTLDEIFFGIWKTSDFKYEVVANELIGSVILHVFHPTLGVWLNRVGAGAVPIQMLSKNKGGTGDITDPGQKIKNTLVKDFPHLLAECTKNAAKKFGKTFGRDLNREFEDVYQPILATSQPETSDIKVIQKKIIDAIYKYTGDDKEEIRQMCADKVQAGEFDLKFAQGVAKKLGVEI